MGDLSIESFWACNSNENFSTEVRSSDGRKEYKVKFGRVFNARVQYDWSCSCDSFKFGRGKYCKHIQQVQASGKYCGWNQQIDGGTPVEDKPGELKCPKCKDSVFAFRAGV